MTTIYMCDTCGATYKTPERANNCELSHMTNEKDRQIHILKTNNIDPCMVCERAYFVYGCEWNCQCQSKCNNYSLFILKEREAL